MSLLLLYRPSNFNNISSPEGVRWREEEKANILIAKKIKQKLEKDLLAIVKYLQEEDDD